MSGTLALIAAVAGGLLLGSHHGARTNHQRSDYNRNDRGYQYQPSDYRTERDQAQADRYGRQDTRRWDAGRTDTGDRADERAQGRWEQRSFSDTRTADRGQRDQADGRGTQSYRGQNYGHRG